MARSVVLPVLFVVDRDSNSLLVRGDSFAKSMSSYLVRAIESTPNVVVCHRTEVVDGAGDGSLERITVADRANDTVEEVSAAAGEGSTVVRSIHEHLREQEPERAAH